MNTLSGLKIVKGDGEIHLNNDDGSVCIISGGNYKTDLENANLIKSSNMMLEILKDISDSTNKNHGKINTGLQIRVREIIREATNSEVTHDAF